MFYSSKLIYINAYLQISKPKSAFETLLPTPLSFKENGRLIHRTPLVNKTLCITWLRKDLIVELYCLPNLGKTGLSICPVPLLTVCFSV